ncbi:MAG: ATP-dependent helicase [Deltaproteobacteria bacterium]|jgi:DNA helicase-2/ATP-dependent DNA helicase PcrA|nr:ATP-dependent helicase [Deltaproteobacteria bacterium]
MAVDYQKLLNPAQFKAVTHEAGPLLIVAGAGSGKTRTLVHRVAWLIEKGHKPWSILLLTFTRKAAQEMLTRSAELVGLAAGRVSGGTFHSLAHNLLRGHAKLLGLSPSFTVLDQDDAEALIGRIRANHPEVKTLERFPNKGPILGLISQSINRQIPLKEVINRSYPHFRSFYPVLKTISQTYQAEKLSRSLVDFDDLLVYLVRLLAENEEARKAIAARYDHVLVDEYQDTNHLQAQLTYYLAKDRQNVTVVGDEAQSIYSFRGASVRNILEFPDLFPGATVVALEDNYRSYAPILTVANKIISESKEKYDKRLVAARGMGPLPILHSAADVATEARLVTFAIQERLQNGRSLADMAVLFRNSTHSYELEVLLQRNGLPFTKYGGRKFLETAHVKGFLSLLRASVNPGDGLSLRRALMDLKGVGEKGAENIANWVGSAHERLANIYEAPASERVKGSLYPLAALMANLIKPDIEVSSEKKALLALKYYQGLLADLFPDDYPSRQEDLKEILPMLANGPDLATALSDISLDPPSSRGQGRAADGRPLDLTLSTIHSAKGLEWGVVFVLSLTEGRFPGPYVKETENLEEERRLLYVAVTRAKDELHLLTPRHCGAWSLEPSLPNRFLSSLTAREVESWSDGQICSFKNLDPSLDQDDTDYIDDTDYPDPDYPDDLGHPEESSYAVPRAANSLRAGKPLKPATSQRSVKTPTARYGEAIRSTPKARPSQPVSQRPAAAKEVINPTEPSSYDPNYQPEKGHRISHPVYGPGLVIKLNDDIVTIDFDHYGIKKIRGPYARLSRLQA